MSHDYCTALFRVSFFSKYASIVSEGHRFQTGSSAEHAEN